MLSQSAQPPKNDDSPPLLAVMFRALVEAENALADYIPTIESSGNASLNYGHKVLNQVRDAIAQAENEAVKHG